MIDLAAEYDAIPAAKLETYEDRSSELEPATIVESEDDTTRFRNPINIGKLMATKFPPLKWIVPDLIPEGLTLLAGPPKIGKSWLTFDLALSVATGGECLKRDVKEGAVLLLALEDNGRRIQDRMQKVLPYHSQSNWDFIGANLEIYDTGNWNPLHLIDSGAMEVLDAWRERHDNARLVIVDVLQKIRPPAQSQKSEYEAIYSAMAQLHRWASEHRVSVVVIHHTKKGGSQTTDAFEAVSGSMGLTASADSTVILSHDTEGDHDGVLYGRGRDLIEFEEPLSFDDCVWLPVEGVDAMRTTEERREIIRVLNNGPESGMNVQAIAEAIKKNRNAVDQLVRKMKRKGEIRRLARGVYGPPSIGTQ